MLKTLIKKQLLEVNAFMVLNRKKGTRKSKMGILLSVVLMLFIFGYMTFIICMLFNSMCKVMYTVKIEWFYFMLVALMALILGVFGSVFNTYSTVYLAKDNEMIVSMPIKPRDILISRLLGVYIMGLFYESMVYVGAIIPLIINGLVDVKTIVGVVLSLLLNSILVLILSALLGWGVAIISSKLQNRSFVSVLASLGFIGIYYFIYFKAMRNFKEFLTNAQGIASRLENGYNPLFHLGNMATGKLMSILFCAVFVGVLLVLTYHLLLHNLTDILTLNKGEKKKLYQEKHLNKNSVFSALYKKELKRFISSANYMLNCGLGALAMPIAAITLLFKKDAFISTVHSIGVQDEMLFTISIAMMLMMCSMIDITAPSISLEGKNVWIYQTLPVDPMEVFNAKIALQLSIATIPVIMCSLSLGYVCSFNILQYALAMLIVLAFILFTAIAGLVINLIWPNLSWTNEVAVIKQSLPVFLAIFGVWIIVALLGLMTVKLLTYMSMMTIAIIILVLIVVCTMAMYVWLKKVGTAKFTRL